MKQIMCRTIAIVATAAFAVFTAQATMAADLGGGASGEEKWGSWDDGKSKKQKKYKRHHDGKYYEHGYSSLWSGGYMGAHAGFGFGEGEDGLEGANLDGAAGGLQLGFNRRHGRTVWGIEGDLSWTDFNDVDVDVEYLGSIRARVGTFAGHYTLLYATGGFAFAEVEVPGDNSDVLGYVVGIGAEKFIRRNASLKAEVLHYELQDDDGGPEIGFDSTVIRAGFNIHLN